MTAIMIVGKSTNLCSDEIRTLINSIIESGNGQYVIYVKTQVLQPVPAN